MDVKKASISEMLFSCEAIKVSPADSPYLYTSGLIGPYYINTHFLCGGENTAQEILDKITKLQNDPESLINEIPVVLEEVRNGFDIFNEIIERMTEIVREEVSRKQISYISGGQRRDWFFSVPLSRKLSLPHLYVFNDKSVYNEQAQIVKDLPSSNVLHVADLLSVGSSYLSKWIPALSSVNLKISLALNCVDRNQGGVENLTEAGIPEVITLSSINEELFDEALSKNILSQDQVKKIKSYLKDPFESMRSFLKENPDYINKSLSSDEKTKERIKKTLDDDMYELGGEFINQFKLTAD